MSKIQTFENFLTQQNAQVSIADLMIHLVVAALLSFILSRIYVKYGTSLSNRKQFSSIFILMTITITLIITIVKSSLALSLGLVGALSIVRFRTAIKEPEELAYLFLTIAIGLGLGAGQLLTTLSTFPLVVAILVARGLAQQKEQEQNLFLSVSTQNPDALRLDQIIKTLTTSCRSVDLRRFDETPNASEATFQVEFDNIHNMQTGLQQLREQEKMMRITFVDSKRKAA